MKYEELPRYCPNCGCKMIFTHWDSTNTVCFFRCEKCGTIKGD